MWTRKDLVKIARGDFTVTVEKEPPFDPFDTPAFNAIIERFNEATRKVLDGMRERSRTGMTFDYPERTVAMFDFGFLCRHGAPYMGCPSCANEASQAADNLVRCPWCKGENARCSACKGKGYVEVIEP